VGLPSLKRSAEKFDHTAIQMNIARKTIVSPGVNVVLSFSVVCGLQFSAFAQDYWEATESEVSKQADTKIATEEEISRLLEVALPGSGPTDPKVAALEQLVGIVAYKPPLPEGFEEAILKILARPEAGITVPAAQIVGFLKLEEARSELESWATSASSRAGVASLKALVSLGGDESLGFMRAQYAQNCKAPDLPEWAEEGPDMQHLRANILYALIELDTPEAAKDVVSHFTRFPNDRYNRRIFEVIISRNVGPAVLARQLKDRNLPEFVAKLGVEVASTSENYSGQLIKALGEAGANHEAVDSSANRNTAEQDGAGQAPTRSESK
jgi:hypothetical protein